MASDPEPVTVESSGNRPELVIAVDHAGLAVPSRLHDLGLPEKTLGRHIGWDIGALDLARGVLQRLGGTLVASAYSRLVIDCNRYPADPASAPARSDGVDVPGNRNLTPIDREWREREIFRPYHEAMDSAMADAATTSAPLLLSVHTMTETMNGQDRPQQAAVLWAGDRRAAGPALDAFAAIDGCTVGDNEPYALDLGIDYTVPEHAMRRGVTALMIEIRQDLVADRAGADAWAARLARLVEPILDLPDLRRREIHWP